LRRKRSGNTWRGVRAPCALPNVPRALPPWGLGRRSGPSAAGRVARLTSLNERYRQLTEGSVGPSRGPRHCWRSARPVARDPRGAAAARRAASRRMFFTNNTEIKRYGFNFLIKTSNSIGFFD